MLAPTLDASGKQVSSSFKRKEQLEKWMASETNQQQIRKELPAKVSFDRGTMFLAACSQADKREVEELIVKGVNPNTSNVDGLTALHQACIDDNMVMVEFLINNGAQVNVCDNEGWTPLHATASCGYTDIAQYLIKHGADISACNSDGDLPIDIAEGTDMENLLAEAMNQQNVNADDARNSEERQMMLDAKYWLEHPESPPYVHPKSGATALHVAAARGYHKVMLTLIQAGADVNHRDKDGWTPLHGAAHWGQEESCKILAENFCDMNLVDRFGQGVKEVADESLVKVIDELMQKQTTRSEDPSYLEKMREKRLKESPDDLSSISKPTNIKRRTSITRMSFEEKEKVIHDSTVEEKGIVLSEDKLPDDSLVSIAEEAKEKPATIENKDEKLSSVTKAELPVPPSKTTKPVEITNKQDEDNERLKLEAQNEKMTTSVLPSSTNTINNSTVQNAAQQQPVEKRAWARMRDQTTPAERASYPAATTSSLSAAAQSAQSLYVPYYKRIQAEREAKQKEKETKLDNNVAEPSSPGIVPAGSSLSSVSDSRPVLDRSASLIEQNSQVPPLERRASRFEAPKRDDEAETNRKIKAKRARETRRSTQGVTQDDVKAAEATLKKAEVPGLENSESLNNIPTLSKLEERTDESSRRRSQREEVTRSSFRKARDVISGTSSSSSIPEVLSSSARPQRVDGNDENRQRYSWRNSDRNGVDNQDDDKMKEEDENDKNKPRLLRSRRNRRERRSTGVIYYDENDTEKNDDDKDKDTTEMNNDINASSLTAAEMSAVSSRPYSRKFGSTSDVPTQMSVSSGTDRGERSSYIGQRDSGDRSSYTGSTNRIYSRRQTAGPSESASTNEIDYKKLFEDMKLENDKLKSRVSSLELELADSKQTIENLKGSNSTRSSYLQQSTESLSEKRERRALERKVSELEEELKKLESLQQDNARLKEENGALIRVISKLSK